MKTAEDVMLVIEAEIDQQRRFAADPAITALVDPCDREEYREAVRRATELRALERLQRILKAKMELANGEEVLKQAAKPRKRRSKKAG